MDVLIIYQKVDLLQEIKEYIYNNFIFPNVFFANDFQTYKKILEENSITLAIIEIGMDLGEYNGLDIASYTYESNKKVEIFFIVTGEDNNFRGIGYYPLGCICTMGKDRNGEVCGIWNEYNRERQKLIVKDGKEIYFLNKEKILFLEVKDGKTIIHERDKEYTSNNNLEYFTPLLGSEFIRVHRSFIANRLEISKITEVGDRSYNIEFYNSSKIAYMSRSGYTNLMESMN